MLTVKKSYAGTWKLLCRYWRIYGGTGALIRSPYFHLSVLLTVVSTGVWIEWGWWSDPISVLPNLLGFTLGGFAIFLGFGDEKFKQVIAGSDMADTSPESPYMGFSSTFLHFVLMQLVALLWALAAKALAFDLPWPSLSSLSRLLSLVGGVIGYWLFFYGICLAAAAGLAIFRVASMYDGYQTRARNNGKAKP